MFKKLIGSLFFVGFVFISQAKTVDNFNARDGILDLGITNALDQSCIKLQGDWEFYWNNLYEPNDFKDLDKIAKPIYVKIPKSWTNYKINGNKIPNKGYATYRVVVHKNSDTQRTIYGLKLSTIFSSYKIWVNGRLLSTVGKVGTSESSSEPGFRYCDIPFVLDPADGPTDNIEIVFQISNFSHQRGGLHFPIYIGTYNNLVSETRWMDILNMVIIGIILVIGINHISLYYFRKEDRSNLYFGIVCIVMILRNISTGDRVITYFMPNINWELLYKLDNFSGFGTIPLFALFFYSLYKKDFPKIARNIILYIGMAITLLVLVTPAFIYGKIRTLFEIYILIGGLYLTFGVLLVATLRKRAYALPSFLGMFILYATAINDVLSSMGVIQTGYVAPFGLVAFMITQSIAINKKSASAINENEELSVQLTHEKENLESRIEERTSELQSQHDQLLKHQEKEQQQNWLNVGIAQINEAIAKDKNSYKKLCQNVLITMVKYLDTKLGAMYILNNDDINNPYLELVSDYGLSKDHKNSNLMIPANSGLIGATFTNNEEQLITSLPENYFAINSGLGSSTPKALFILPLTFENNVLGVIELATFKELNDIEIEFARKVAISIAANLNTVKMNERNIQLIQQFKENTQRMQENEARMKQNLDELEYIREQYDSLKGSKVIEN